MVALKRGGRRQDDVGVARHRRPPRLTDNNRLRLLPGPQQPVQILVVMEHIAPGPVNEPNIGVDIVLAIIGKQAVGIQQHVGNASNRNNLLDRIRTPIQHRPVEPIGVRPNGRDRAVSIAESTARQTDLAQYGGQADQHPERLLTVIRPLERPRGRDQRPLSRHPTRQPTDRLSRNPGHGRRPVGIFGLAVGVSHQVGSKLFKSDAAAGQKILIVQPLGDQGVGQPQHQGHIRIGTRGKPLGSQKIGRVVLDRSHIHKLDARPLTRPQAVGGSVTHDAAVADLGILQRNPAKHHNEFRVGSDSRPRRLVNQKAEEVARHIRHDDIAGRCTIGVHRADKAAEQTEKALEPAGPDHRLADAQLIINACHVRAAERRGSGILRDGTQGDETPIPHLGIIASPVESGSGRRRLGHRVCPGCSG